MPETFSPRNQTVSDRAVSVARTLPPDVLDALSDLYDADRQQQWLARYALTCRRNRIAMVFFALRDAGYPPHG